MQILVNYYCCLPLRSYIDTNLWVFLIYLYFFLLNLIIIIIKFFQPMSSTRPNLTHVGWVGFMWWVGLGWIFLTHHGRLGPKISLTRPMHTSISELGENLLALMVTSKPIFSIFSGKDGINNFGNHCFFLNKIFKNF